MSESDDLDEQNLQFETNEKVLCFHGPLIYEAKILNRQWMDETPELQGPHYYVHYKGWKRTWDEWVPESRVLRWNDSNLKIQQQLKDLYTNKKSNRSSSCSDSSTSNDLASNNKKRQRQLADLDEKEEAFLNNPEIRIDIPDTLKGQLVDDWENITKDQQLVPLPRTLTVSQILEQYKQFKKEKKGNRDLNEEFLDEILHGIRTYFNKALGTMLLYRFERHQYANIRKQYPEKEMADLYGAEHLLRLFVQLPTLIAHTDMDTDAVFVLTRYLTDLLRYMQKAQRSLFLSEYENAPPGYASVTNSD